MDFWSIQISKTNFWNCIFLPNSCNLICNCDNSTNWIPELCRINMILQFKIFNLQNKKLYKWGPTYILRSWLKPTHYKGEGESEREGDFLLSVRLSVTLRLCAKKLVFDDILLIFCVQTNWFLTILYFCDIIFCVQTNWFLAILYFVCKQTGFWRYSV